MYRNIWVLLFLSIISINITTAQRISTIKPVVGVQDGLAQNSILQITQDDLGLVWLGTEVGLSRWNGKNVVNYPNSGNESLPGGFIKAIHSDYNGTLWVVPGDDKLYYKQGVSETFREAIIDISGFRSEVTHITSDSSKDLLLFITKDNKVYSWDYTLSGIKLVANFRHKNITDLQWFKGELLFASDRGWLILDNNLNIKQKEKIDWLDNSENPIYDIEVIEDNIFAARDKWGITVHNPSVSQYKNWSIESLDLIKDYNNQLISSNSGDSITVIYNIDEPSFIDIKKPVDIDITHFYTLESGQTVIGTKASGLWMIDPFIPHFSSWTHQKNLSRDIVSMAEDREGNLWLSTFNSGVLFYNNKTDEMKEYNISTGKAYSDSINHIVIDNSGRIWASSSDRGFFLYSEDSDSFEPHVSSGLRNKIYSRLRINYIEPLDDNTLLISTEKGLYEYSIETKVSTLLFTSFVWASLIDDEQNIWIATNSGLYKRQSDIYVQFGEISDPVWFIQENIDGEMILGSPAGIKILNSEGITKNYTNLNEYLTNKSVYSVIIDRLGYYWITTNRGIFRWDRESDKLEIYTTRDGLLSNEFNLNSAITRVGGTLLFGNMQGLNEIDPTTVISNPYPTKIIVDKLEKISYSDQVVDSDYGTLRNLDKVIIEPDENIFRVGFQAIEFHDNKNIDIKYQLVGLSDRWVDVSNENNILFVNLSPKHYVLNIVATNINNNSTFVKSIKIEVKPYFTETTLFSFIIILIISLFIAVVILYVNKLRREIILRRAAEQKYTKLNSDLESVLERKTEELKLSNERIIQQEKMSSLGQLVAGVAHEINTPLGVAILSNSFINDIIQKLSQKFKSRTLTEKNLEESMDEIEQASEQLTFNLDRASNLIKNFKQVAVDKNTDSVVSFDLSSSLESLLNSLRIKLKHNNVTINCNTEDKLIINSFPSEFSQIITNLIMNSINHGFGEKFKKSEKIITINVVKSDETCIIQYHDNGCGIAEDHIHKIFDPFFTTNRSFGGTGLGLNIVYNIINEKLNGKVDVKSVVGGFTEFTISIPVDLT